MMKYKRVTLRYYLWDRPLDPDFEIKIDFRMSILTICVMTEEGMTTEKMPVDYLTLRQIRDILDPIQMERYRNVSFETNAGVFLDGYEWEMSIETEDANWDMELSGTCPDLEAIPVREFVDVVTYISNIGA